MSTGPCTSTCERKCLGAGSLLTSGEQGLSYSKGVRKSRAQLTKDNDDLAVFFFCTGGDPMGAEVAQVILC